MTIAELEADLRARLRAFDNPAFEARQILQAGLGLSAAELMAHGDRQVKHDDLVAMQVWGERRREGYPLAYLTGRKGFYKHEFIVAPRVLVPRPETEHVVEAALARGEVARMADLGCGTGCIGLSLLAEWPSAHLSAVDASNVAVDVTRRNAKALGLESRTEVIHARVEDWSPSFSLDLIVANPPYIAEGDSHVQKSVDQFEPHAALYSGRDGLDAIRSWSTWAKRHLRDGGFLIYEIGSGQKQAVEDILKGLGFRSIASNKDLAGHDRVVTAQK
jgi:release factor glutamine methyltransferase